MLLTDVSLHGGDGIELREEVPARNPETQIMVTTASGDERTVGRADR